MNEEEWARVESLKLRHRLSLRLMLVIWPKCLLVNHALDDSDDQEEDELGNR